MPLRRQGFSLGSCPSQGHTRAAPLGAALFARARHNERIRAHRGDCNVQRSNGICRTDGLIEAHLRRLRKRDTIDAAEERAIRGLISETRRVPAHKFSFGKGRSCGTVSFDRRLACPCPGHASGRAGDYGASRARRLCRPSRLYVEAPRSQCRRAHGLHRRSCAARPADQAYDRFPPPRTDVLVQHECGRCHSPSVDRFSRTSECQIEVGAFVLRTVHSYSKSPERLMD